jgi:hypothetical protein
MKNQSNKRWVYIFWNDLYISKFTYSTKEGLYLCGKKFVEENIRNNKPISFQKKVFKNYADIIYQRKKNKEGIRRSDHQLLLQSLLGLWVLKGCDEDDILYYAPKYKKKSIKSNTKIPLNN